jgi:hypothetical protein
MAVSVSSVSAIATNSGTTVTVTKPTGLEVGDLIVVQLGAIGGDVMVSSDWTVPGGWTANGNDNWSHSGPGAGLRHAIMYKIADSGDVAASNFTFTYGTSTGLRGAMFRITGQRPASFIAATNLAKTSNNAYDTSPKAYAAGVTPTIEDSLIMIFVLTYNGSSFGSYALATSDPGGWTEAHDASNLAMAYANRSQTTATGDVTIAWSGSNVGNIVIVYAISPAFGVTVSPSVINATGAVLTPTITGGMTATPATINVVGTLNEPAVSEKPWRKRAKSSPRNWTPKPKS